MASIDIQHAHALPDAQARMEVEAFARRLAEKFGLDWHWDGEVMHFNRSGVDGRIALGPGQLRVHAKLGMLLSAMKGPIEAEIRRALSERFV